MTRNLIAILLLTTLISAATDTRVADAAMKGDKEAVRSLIRQAADVNAAQGDGMTALHWAALNGDAEMAQTLLFAGASVKATTRIGAYTPLLMAAKTGQAAIVDALLKAGADPKSTATTGLNALMLAATSGDAGSVKLLLEHGVDPNAKESERGQTALGLAAAFDRPEAIRVLLQHGADVNLASSVITPAPPAAAGARGGQGGAAAALAAANAGADGSSKGGGNAKGALTPLMYAAREGHIEAAHALVDGGATLNALNGDKSTALLLAIINGHFDIAKYLVDRGADVNLSSVDGASPLYGVVNTQWARKSFQPQPSPRYDKTTSLELMAALLDRGANPNVRLTKELWYSEYNRSLESASAVGTTAFWKCAEVGDIDGMRLLVSRGADPNIGSTDGVTPLLMASGAGTHGNDDVTAPAGRLAAVKYLVEELHADVNSADTGGPNRTENAAPVAANQTAPAARVTGAAPAPAAVATGGPRPSGGYTALHNAAVRGDNAMILYLVSKGARVDAVSKTGVTVADMANGPRQRIQPYPETVALLEMLGSQNSHKCVSC